MAWRFRKSVKLFPGIKFNLSKSGISTTVGVRGASVTFGPKGTYLNTGIPGTGIYAREKISGGGTCESCDNNYFLSDNSASEHDKPNAYSDYFLVSAKGIEIHIFESLYYLVILIAFIAPIVGFVIYTFSDWWMFFCCLFVDFVQLVCFAFLDNSDSNLNEKYAYKLKWVREDTERIAIKQITGHKFRETLAIAIVVLNLFPLLAMNSSFMRNFTYRKCYDGGIIVLFMTIIMVVLWVSFYTQERNMAKCLRALVMPLFKGADKGRKENVKLSFSDICIGEKIKNAQEEKMVLMDIFENYKSYKTRGYINVNEKKHTYDCIINCINDVVISIEVVFAKDIAQELYLLYTTKYGIPKEKNVKDYEKPFCRSWNYSNQRIVYQYQIFCKYLNNQHVLIKNVKIDYIDNDGYRELKKITKRMLQKKNEEKIEKHRKQLLIQEQQNKEQRLKVEAEEQQKKELRMKESKQI